jgi:hypothetical protein
MKEYAVMPLSDYKEICDSIRNKTKEEKEIKSGDIPIEINTVYEQGKQAEYDRFWDEYQNSGSRQEYNNAFRNSMWNDETYKPKYDITGIKGFAAAYATSQITDTKVSITASTLNQGFQNCTKLVTIRTLTLANFNGNFTNAFQNCSALESIIFAGVIGQNGLNLQWSTKLSHDSIVNIINCLSTATSGLSVTLSKTAVENAFTDEEWTKLEQTRPNWTIVLV